MLMARMGLVCSFLGSFDSSDLWDALDEPLCPRGLGRQRRGAARLLVLAEARCFPLPVVGSLQNKLQPPLLAQLRFCTKRECPASPSVGHIPTYLIVKTVRVRVHRV